MPQRFHAGHILGGSLFLVVPVAVIASHGLAPLFILAILGVLALKGRAAFTSASWPLPFLALMAGFLAWGALSLAWTPSTHAPKVLLAVTGEGLGAVLLAMSAWRLAPPERAFAGRAQVAGAALGALMLLLFLGRSWIMDPHHVSPLYNRGVVDNGVNVLSLMALPAIALLSRDGLGRRAWGLIIVVFLAVMLGQSMAAKLAFLSGLALFLGLRRARGQRPAVVAGLLAAMVVAAPLAAGALPPPQRIAQAIPHFPGSSVHRLYIWENAYKLIIQHPWRGWGLDSSRTFGNDPKAIDYDFWANGNHYAVTSAMIPLHPHEASLQWWLELGLPGALLGAGLLLLLGRAIARNALSPCERALGTAALVAGFLIASVAYGIWQSWWLCGLGMLAVAVSVAAGGAEPGEPAA